MAHGALRGGHADHGEHQHADHEAAVRAHQRGQGAVERI